MCLFVNSLMKSCKSSENVPVLDLPTWGAKQATRLAGWGLFSSPDPDKPLGLRARMIGFHFSEDLAISPINLSLLLPQHTQNWNAFSSLLGLLLLCRKSIFPVIIGLERGLFISIKTTDLIATERPNVRSIHGPTF